MSHDDAGAERDPDDQAHVDRAKAAAQEAIGKLIGDDAQVRKARAAQKGAEPPPPDDKTLRGEKP